MQRRWWRRLHRELDRGTGWVTAQALHATTDLTKSALAQTNKGALQSWQVENLTNQSTQLLFRLGLQCWVCTRDVDFTDPSQHHLKGAGLRLLQHINPTVDVALAQQLRGQLCCAAIEGFCNRGLTAGFKDGFKCLVREEVIADNFGSPGC